MRLVPRLVVSLGLALPLAALGCAEAKQVGREVEQTLNPFAAGKVSLLGVDAHGPYLMAQFRQRSSILTFFAPAADEACARLLRPEATLVYRRHGNFGRFERDDETCDPVGVGSLAAWRDRQPRGSRRGSVVPRATARFREIARDEQFVLVRGRFPLAGRAQIPAGQDLVAFLPHEPACERPLARGEGSLEFVPTGPTAFRLVGDRGLCPVAGFAIPIGD